MSRFIEINPETGKNEIWLDDPKRCKHLYNGVCCENLSRFVADYPTTEQCQYCRYYQKETLKVGERIRSTLTDRKKV